MFTNRLAMDGAVVVQDYAPKQTDVPKLSRTKNSSPISSKMILDWQPRYNLLRQASLGRLTKQDGTRGGTWLTILIMNTQNTIRD